MSPAPAPELPSLSTLKVFVLGALWAAVGGLGPAALLIVDSLSRWQGYQNPVDWPQVVHLGISGAALGLVAYWRKHEAWLATPPKNGKGNV